MAAVKTRQFSIETIKKIDRLKVFGRLGGEQLDSLVDNNKSNYIVLVISRFIS